jgi:hypothetical protein
MAIGLGVRREAIDAYKFRKLCAEQAGRQIFRSVSDVKGFLDRTNSEGPGQGYLFGEEERDGKILRYTRHGDRIREEEVPQLSSEYVYERSEIALPYHIRRFDTLIRELRSDIVLARETDILYAGGWLKRLLQGGGIAYDKCGPTRSGDDVEVFKHSTLVPPGQSTE